MNIEEIKDFVYEVRTFGITSNDTKFVQITEYLLSELEKEKEKDKNARDYIYDLLNNDDIINIGIDDMKIILDILEE